MPADFWISAGGGGGAAGRYESFAIEASGAVIRRSSNLGPNMGELVGRVDVAKVVEIWALSQQIGLEKIPSRYDNMTVSISLFGNGRSLHVAQPDSMMQGDPKPGDASPEQQAAFFHLLRSVEGLAGSRKAPPPAKGPVLLSGSVNPTWNDGNKSLSLKVGVTNSGEKSVMVPNGRSQSGFMNNPFGAKIQWGDERGAFQPDPGAGGPALPIGAEHWTKLAKGEKLEIEIDIGAWIRIDEKGNKVALSKSPGRYALSLSWKSPDGLRIEPAPGAELWVGETDPVEMRIFVD